MAYHGPGANIMNPNTEFGLSTKRRNPKRKGRLPYHAKKHLSLSIVMPNTSKCFHAIGQHEDIVDQNGRIITMSYAVQCTVGHKRTTKSPTHKAGKVSWK